MQPDTLIPADVLIVYHPTADEPFKDAIELLKKEWDPCVFEENKGKAVFMVENAFKLTLMLQQLYVEKMKYLTIHVGKCRGARSETLLEEVHVTVRSVLEDKLESKGFNLAFKCTCFDVRQVPHFMKIDSSASPMQVRCQNAPCTVCQELDPTTHLLWFVS